MLESNRRRILETVGPEDVVLDVGGWANPLPRADWVIDLMPYETRGLYQREGWATGEPGEPERFSERTWIERDACDREPFPFGDGEVDFVVCAQTLEDLRDPVWVCSEMNRVARAGYIEVPSRLEEQAHGFEGPWIGWSHHRWFIDVREDGISFVAKLAEAHSLPSGRLPPGFRDALPDEDRVQALWWSGGFGCEERVFLERDDYADYLSSFVAEARRHHEMPLEAAPPARGGLARLLRRR